MSDNAQYVDQKRKKPKRHNRLWNTFRQWVGFNPELGVFSNLLSKYDQYRFKKVGKDPRRKEVTKETQLLIDGYRSSANSYLVRCFQQIIKDGDFRYADHHHSPSLIIKAVKLDVPVLLCIREPLDVCVSGARRWSMWGVEKSLQHYEKFYSLLLPYLNGMVVSEFKYSIKDPVAVFVQVNNRFNINLDMDNIEIDKTLAERLGRNEQEISEEKRVEKLEKEKIRKEFLEYGDRSLLDRCNAIYKQVLNDGVNVLQLK